MSRLARGDRSAFGLLFGALRPRALRLARAKLGPDAAPDVAQTAMLKVFARASAFTPGRPCLPWFYAIVANEIRATRRGVRDSREPKESDWVDENDGESQLAARELERALELAMGNLDETSANAVAAMLGRVPRPSVTPETFRKRLSRAYCRLRLLLGDHDGS
jgi:DNA-directed RNA polymerase specialized sigma24 family protein